MTVVTLRPVGNVAVAIKRCVTSEGWNYLPICIRIILIYIALQKLWRKWCTNTPVFMLCRLETKRNTLDFVFVIRLLLRYNTESIFKDRKFSKSQNEFSNTKLTAVFMTCYCLAISVEHHSEAFCGMLSMLKFCWLVCLFFFFPTHHVNKL